MKEELRAKILHFNARVKQHGQKAGELDILVVELLKLPPGQLKKVLTEEVLEVLKKYGYTDD